MFLSSHTHPMMMPGVSESGNEWEHRGSGGIRESDLMGRKGKR